MSYYNVIYNHTKYPEYQDSETGESRPEWCVSQHRWVFDYLNKTGELIAVDNERGLYEIPTKVVLRFIRDLGISAANVAEACWELYQEREEAEKPVPIGYMLARIFKKAFKEDELVLSCFYDDWEAIVQHWITTLTDILCDMDPEDKLYYQIG